MSDPLFPKDEIHYRALHGKLFAALLGHFGTKYVSEIEDAIQNSFLKSLKIWKQNKGPDRIENWLFIVARNDVLNQIKTRERPTDLDFFELGQENQLVNHEKDLRLQTIIFIASLEIISTKAKVIFILKNIFGLNIREIHDCTLLNQEAIYKIINRTKKNLHKEYALKSLDIHSISADHHTVAIVEDILYCVFNIGFDSFSEKTEEIVNKDLCLEAYSLAKMLLSKYESDTTSNLLAVFSLHTARIPAKIENNKLISFFNQNREKWNQELFQLALQYLKKPKATNKFYLEALIIAKYMTVQNFTEDDWSDIVHLYKIVQQVSSSPIVKLNYCYCLSKVGKTEQALVILSEIEKELPNEHTYFNLVKAKLLKIVNPTESDQLFTLIMNSLNQKIRREYLLENELIPL